MTDSSGQSWDLAPIWVGPQAPCTSYTNRFSTVAATAYSQGEAQASDAFYEVDTVLQMGSDTPITYDLEAPEQFTSACETAAQSFINGWTHQLAISPPQTAGVYGSVCDSDLQGFAGISRPPEFIYGAWWDNNSATTDMACVSSSSWDDNQRLKQYLGPHDQPSNGVTLDVDSDSVDGPLYAYPPSS